MAHFNSGIPFKYDGKLSSRFKHQDALIMEQTGKNHNLYKSMIGMMGVLDQGLGGRSGRNNSYAKQLEYDKRMRSVLGKVSHTKANQAYLRKLFVRYKKNATVHRHFDDNSSEQVELTAREQLENNIKFIEASYDYSDVSRAERAQLTRNTEDPSALVEKARKFLDEHPDDENLVADFTAHMLEDADPKGMEAIEEMEAIFKEIDGDVKALGSAMSDGETYSNLTDDFDHYVPHLVVGSALAPNPNKHATPMAQRMGTGINRSFGVN